MLIDFSVAPNLTALQVVSDFQYASGYAEKANFGHVKIRLEGIQEVQVQILPGFHSDLDYAYGYKGNEIYEFTFETGDDDKLVVTLRSDLLTFTATCPKAGLKHFVLSD